MKITWSKTMGIEKLFEGNDLSPELTAQISGIFESEVSSRVESEVLARTAAIEEKLKEENASVLESMREEIKSELESTLVESNKTVLEEKAKEMATTFTSFCDYVAEQWMKDNVLAVESGVKVELAESLFKGIQSVLSENNIELDVDAQKQIEEAQAKVDSLSEKVTGLVAELDARKHELLEAEKAIVVTTASRELAMTQVEKLVEMASAIKTTDLQEFKVTVEGLVESLSESQPPAPSIMEGTTNTGSDIDSDVSRYAQFLGKNKVV